MVTPYQPQPRPPARLLPVTSTLAKPYFSIALFHHDFFKILKSPGSPEAKEFCINVRLALTQADPVGILPEKILDVTAEPGSIKALIVEADYITKQAVDSVLLRGLEVPFNGEWLLSAGQEAHPLLVPAAQLPMPQMPLSFGHTHPSDVPVQPRIRTSVKTAFETPAHEAPVTDVHALYSAVRRADTRPAPKLDHASEELPETDFIVPTQPPQPQRPRSRDRRGISAVELKPGPPLPPRLGSSKDSQSVEDYSLRDAAPQRAFHAYDSIDGARGEMVELQNPENKSHLRSGNIEIRRETPSLRSPGSVFISPTPAAFPITSLQQSAATLEETTFTDDGARSESDISDISEVPQQVVPRHVAQASQVGRLPTMQMRAAPLQAMEEESPHYLYAEELYALPEAETAKVAAPNVVNWLHGHLDPARVEGALTGYGEGAFVLHKNGGNQAPTINLSAYVAGSVQHLTINVTHIDNVKINGVTLPSQYSISDLVSDLSKAIPTSPILPAPLTTAIALSTVAPPYVHRIDAASAEHLLASHGSADGLFLVRKLDAPKPGAEYILDLVWDDSTFHYFMGLLNGTFCLDNKPVRLADGSRYAMSLEELIAALSAPSILPHPLTRSVPRFKLDPKYLSANGDRPPWLHSLLDAKDVARLLSGQPGGTFLVREASLDTALLSYVNTP